MEIDLSDHTMGIGSSVAAVAHGATVIEKHFTLNRADGGLIDPVPVSVVKSMGAK
jgi:N-acetylneuraminate synthase